MKTLLRFLPLLVVPLLAVGAQSSRSDTASSQRDRVRNAADEKVIAAVRAADDQRLAVTKAADRAGLEAIYSDDLHYAHSNGRVDNKASQIDIVVSGNTRYEEFDHKERTFIPVAPGIVLMKGRATVHMRTKAGEKSTIDLNYLAVWREENGKWRFLAWQSSRIPAPAVPANAKSGK